MGNRVWLLRGGVVALAAVVALVAWLATREPSQPAAAESGSRLATRTELAERATLTGHPVYWAGPVPRTRLELIEVEGDGTQVRYVPEGAAAGEAGDGLTIGSYPLPNPRKSLAAFASKPGAVVRQARDGSEVMTTESRPTSVYFASPDNSVEVEVYDPSARKAMSLALSGRVQPVR